jgi:GAF domain-containing protein
VANQTAVALRNARRFEETTQALATAERLQQQYIQHGWQTFLATHKTTTYQQVQPGAAPVDDSLLTQIKQGVAQGQKVVISRSESGDGEGNGRPESAIAFPLALRGQIIGTIRVHDTQTGRQWTSEEITLLESIGEQMSLAIENARLFDDTKRRATREQIARKITDEMRSSPDIDTIIQTGLTELAKALGVSRTYVKLSPSSE